MLTLLPPLPDLALLIGAALAAGTVRGFSGFGTALIFLPMAAIVLDPVAAITAVVVMDILGPLPALPSAAHAADWRDLRRLLTGVSVALPFGLGTLFLLDPDVFRTLVSAIALAMLALLIVGWRYAGAWSPRLIYGTGMASGYLGGVAGIPGPPVIFVYMASPKSPVAIRANITFFLLFNDWLTLGLLAILGRLTWEAAAIGLILILPNMAGNLLGALTFRPEKERIYRAVAYVIIAAAAVGGLPFLRI